MMQMIKEGVGLVEVLGQGIFNRPQMLGVDINEARHNDREKQGVV